MRSIKSIRMVLCTIPDFSLFIIADYGLEDALHAAFSCLQEVQWVLNLHKCTFDFSQYAGNDRPAATRELRFLAFLFLVLCCNTSGLPKGVKSIQDVHESVKESYIAKAWACKW